MDVIEIGRRIRKARDIKNLTLDEIANDIGVAKSTVQRYENGLITNPKLPVLHAIANSLKVNPSWLSGQDVPMEIQNKKNASVNINEKVQILQRAAEEEQLTEEDLEDILSYAKFKYPKAFKDE